jgi:branched-chain amino acid transport system substrate-binding protein
MTSRRQVLTRSAAILGAASTSLMLPARAQNAKVRIGMMFPYTGTFAQLGLACDNGFRMALEEKGNKLGGREIEYFKVDDESEPAKGVENANKLVQRDKVDVVIGTIHSGVQMGIHKVARETGVLSIIPNAGMHAATRALCAPNVFRASFSNSQPTRALGKVMVDKGHKKAVWITWKYAAGDEAGEGFKEGYLAAGGTIVKELGLPFPNVEFQALLTEIASIKPDAVACFFSGGGASKFIRDYAAAGLAGKIPLYGSGFLTDGTLEAQGADADGLLTTLHYADNLNNKRDQAFRLAYAKTYKLQPDVYAVQGYDAGQMLGIGLNATKGDAKNIQGFAQAVRAAKIDSPRGPFTMSKSHNPVQDIYLRKVVGKENVVDSIASKALTDPGLGCKM